MKEWGRIMKNSVVIALLFAGCIAASTKPVFGASFGPMSETRLGVSIRDTGSCTVPAASVMDENELPASISPDAMVTVNVRSIVLRHPLVGLVLLDAGMDRSFQSCRTGRFRGEKAAEFLRDFAGCQTPGSSLAECLGAEKGGIAAIAYSHLHFDHIAGTVDLPRARRHIAGKGESFATIPGVFEADYLSDVAEMETPRFDSGYVLPPFGEAADLLGDGSLLAFALEGHSPGGLVFLFWDGNEPVLYLGDALTELSDGGYVAPGRFSKDRDVAREKAIEIRTFLAAHPEVRGVASHKVLTVREPAAR